MGNDSEINVLFVDDEAIKLGDSLEEMLNILAPGKAPYRVKSITDYHRALSALEGADIVLVGVDLTIEYNPLKYQDFLPHMDEQNVGYRLIRHIREEHPRLKAIVLATLSACKGGSMEEEARAKEEGAAGFLIKPFRAAELVEVILHSARKD